ncbi:MAG: MarR family transcriptional regulator [Leifsonia xyli]|nr:MAG: MarR family transcriptional regulator [Leifsonia xyli]
MTRHPIPGAILGRMSTTSEVSPEDWALWRDYFRGGRELVTALDRRLQDDAGISHPEFLLMMSLSRAPERSLRTGELADELTWEKSRVSHQVTRMEARGLVARRECETDARGVWVELTPAGSRLLLEATRDHTDAIREWFFDLLDEDERRVLGAIAKRMRENLGTVCAGAVPPPAEARPGDAA